MCGIVILFLFGFGSLFEKNSDSVWNEFGSVLLSENRLRGYQIFGRLGFGLDFFYPNPNRISVFRTPLIIICFICCICFYLHGD